MSRRLVLDDGRTQRELVVKERMTIGRDPSCDISDSDPRLSRRHAELLATTRGLVVRDLDSRNGIRLNGRAVQEAVLAPGDLVEIGHLGVRFLDDAPAEPAGQALPTLTPLAVEGVQVRDGFEDDRTRVLRAPVMSTEVSGPIVIDRLVAPRSAGEVAIQQSRPAAEAGPATAARPAIVPRPGLGVMDLLGYRWGWRVLGQGALLAGLVFLITALPILNWFSGTAGRVGSGVLVRMLAAPLLASLFAGLMVASLIARTTARGLDSHEHS